MAPSFIRGSMPAKSLRLISAFSTMASITRSALATPSPLHVGNEAIEGGLDEVRLLQALLVERVGALDGGRDALGGEVLQRDRDPLERAPGRDVAAHGAGADHVQVADRLPAFLAQRLHAVLQLEQADEVARRRMREEARHRRRMLDGDVPHVPAEVLPQVDDRVGRRVVVLARLLGHLLARHRRHERAHDRPVGHGRGKRRLVRRRRLGEEHAHGVGEMALGRRVVDEAQLLRAAAVHARAR